MNYRVK